MPRSTLSRAATAVAALASTASAAYVHNGNSNVVMYWGQGNAQLTLSEACADPSIDVMTLAFVNSFPSKRGEYPGTNFANACWGTYYPDPMDSTKKSKLLKDCPSINEGIAVCRQNNKKVLLSLGGGLPTDYYLPDTDTTNWFAEFLVGAFGPQTGKWTGPRPFGDQYVDGFDLDLEAEASQVPDPSYISANYAQLVNQLKTLQPNLLITAAPQCEVPDIRLADAITNAPFDMIFTQFYNTPKCSARTGVTELKTGGSQFTFQKWTKFLDDHSQNRDVKLYLGLPAGSKGSPSYPDHYLAPNEANDLVNKWRVASKRFGGIMLWEDKVSADNVIYCSNYSTWMKSILSNSFTSKWNKGDKNCVKTSSLASSSTKASSTKASSTPASSTKASSTLASSTKASSSMASSTKASSSMASSTKASSSLASSTPASSIKASSTVTSSTKVSTTSAAISPTATMPTVDGNCGDQGNGIVLTCYGYNYGSCCSSHGYCGGEQSAPSEREAYCGEGCNPLFGTCDSTSKSTSVATSTPAASSSVVSSSSIASSSAGSSSTVSSSIASSSSVASSSTLSSSSVASSSAVSSTATPAVSSSAPASSSIYSATTPAASSSVPYPSGNATYTPYPTGTGSASVVYPADVSKTLYPHSSETLSYASQSSVHYPAGNATTPCTTSTTVSSSSTPTPVYGASTTPCSSSTLGHSSKSAPVYGASSSPAPVYGASSSPAPVYGASSSPAPVYGASSSPAPVYGGSYPPSVTSKPGQDYPSSPASSTVKVITTTYVDSCETGITTKTETITQTVCNKCNGDSVTSVYVCNNCGPAVVTYTITKPATPATNVPVVPTMPAQPSSPVYGGEKPQPPAQESTPSYGGGKPDNTPSYDVPKKQEVPGQSTTVEIVYVTKTPVPIMPTAQYTPAMPYPSAPAQNGTSGYPVKPSGTGAAPPTKPTSYTPPAQFTGAASHVGVGMTGFLAVIAGLLVL